MPVALGAPSTTRTRTCARCLGASPAGRRTTRRCRGQRWPAAGAPDLGKGVHEVGDRGAAQLDPGVAPGLQRALRIALPLGADAQSADVAHLPVDDDGLAVIAREPAQRARQPRRVEDAHLHAALTQRRPQGAGTERAQPVANDADAQTGAGPRDECGGKPATDLVVVDDVALEQHVALRLLDCGQPRRDSSPSASSSRRTALPPIGSAPVARPKARSADASAAGSGCGVDRGRRVLTRCPRRAG